MYPALLKLCTSAHLYHSVKQVLLSSLSEQIQEINDLPIITQQVPVPIFEPRSSGFQGSSLLLSLEGKLFVQKCLLFMYYTAGNVLGSGNRTMTKTYSCLQVACNLA